MLAVLEEKGVTITFNILGQWAEVRPESLQLIASAGHELGNHGYHHKNYSELSAEEVKEEITTSADLIEELTGVRPAILPRLRAITTKSASAQRRNWATRWFCGRWIPSTGGATAHRPFWTASFATRRPAI